MHFHYSRLVSSLCLGQQVRAVNHQSRTSDVLVHGEVQDSLSVVPRRTGLSEWDAPFVLEVLLLVALVGLDRGHFTGAVGLLAESPYKHDSNALTSNPEQEC
jgi:hypothetical protein